jgi:hypothetical protein
VGVNLDLAEKKEVPIRTQYNDEATHLLQETPPTGLDSIGGLSGINHRRLPVICQ